MDNIRTLISKSRIHPQWRPLLNEALQCLDPDYRQQLISDSTWLPGIDKVLSAFQRDPKNLKYLLIGESPYPRAQSANGIAFYDAAVGDLWSDSGLSKAVNRATSMRNILKTALLAEGLVIANEAGKITQETIASVDKTDLVKTMAALFENLHNRGFLMLNATPVLHPHRKPVKEAQFWRLFLDKLLSLLAETLSQPASLILWGKIAVSIEELAASQQYVKLISEHPYNISFIHNPDMQSLFAELKILQK